MTGTGQLARTGAAGIVAAVVLGVVGPVAAAPASTLELVAPSTAVVGRSVSVTYAGLVEPVGPSTAEAANVAAFVRNSAAPCAATPEAEFARANADTLHQFDVPTASPFRRTERHRFAGTGRYTVCAYLQDFSTGTGPTLTVATRSVLVRRCRSGFRRVNGRCVRA